MYPPSIRRTPNNAINTLLISLIILVSSVFPAFAQFGQITPGSGITIFGRVRLPDNKPAVRVKVLLEGPKGLVRDTLTDDQGQYEIRGMIAGKYRMMATNPNAPEQYTDPVESDTNRAYANRLQIDIYLRLPITSGKNNLNPGTVSANEITQNIPKAARKAYEQGINLQKENRVEQALPQFTQAIDLYPEYFQALTERANLLMQQNKLTEAELDFAQAVQHNPKYPPALRGLGYCQIQQKKFGDALGNLEKAFSLEPDVPMTLLLLGYANLSVNHYEEAKLCLQEALRKDSVTTARAHVYLAEVFAHEQNFKAAADEIRDYLKAKPNAADAAQLRAMETKWRAQGNAKTK